MYNEAKYDEETIINCICAAAEEVTDDCAYSGILTLGAIILNVSEDTVNEIIINKIEE